MQTDLQSLTKIIYKSGAEIIEFSLSQYLSTLGHFVVRITAFGNRNSNKLPPSHHRHSFGDVRISYFYESLVRVMSFPTSPRRRRRPPPSSSSPSPPSLLPVVRSYWSVIRPFRRRRRTFQRYRRRRRLHLGHRPGRRYIGVIVIVVVIAIDNTIDVVIVVVVVVVIVMVVVLVVFVVVAEVMFRSGIDMTSGFLHSTSWKGSNADPHPRHI